MKTTQQHAIELVEGLQAEQTFLGSCREACDESGKARWDRLQHVIDDVAICTQPIDMILYCPSCGTQHIDKAEEPDRDYEGDLVRPIWDNPAHRTHKCAACNCHWRPADVATNGVERIATKGKKDTWLNGGLAIDAESKAAAPTTRTREAAPATMPARNRCDVPPTGWVCTRENGHSGPCAALHASEAAPKPEVFDSHEVDHGSHIEVVPHHGSHIEVVPHHGSHIEVVPHHGSHIEVVPHHGSHIEVVPHHGSHIEVVPHHGSHIEVVPHHGEPAKPQLARLHPIASESSDDLADNGECCSSYCECEPGECSSGRVDKRDEAAKELANDWRDGSTDLPELNQTIGGFVQVRFEAKLRYRMGGGWPVFADPNSDMILRPTGIQWRYLTDDEVKAHVGGRHE